jgi:predicted CopG family antitoxin
MGTTITVSDETWKDLNRQKEPGETFDEVVQRLLENHQEATA